MNYDAMFRRATGNEPFPYQRRLAIEGPLPHLVQAPTGSGKTAAMILGWLWRRRFVSSPEVITPRRLIYCLPMRVLVEQTEREARRWLERLGISDIGVHVLMGGEAALDWDLRPEQEAILIGTQDMVLSRALNRGYGMSRYRWPMQFALLNNDCLWVMDEIQLMGSGLATTTQLEAFRKKLGTVGVVQSVWMSATLLPNWLGTVDFKDDVPALRRIELSNEDKLFGSMRSRYEGHKPIAPARITGDRNKALAALVQESHRAGSLTLVVVNTVDRARELYQALRDVQTVASGKKSKKARSAIAEESVGPHPELVLLHSRFRPKEREERLDQLQSRPPLSGRIVVSTQVIEAGVDISAKTLFTELAPWPSLVQRFGRCNRYGLDDDARVFWVDLNTSGKKSEAAPYSEGELDAARSVLNEEGTRNDVGLAELERFFRALTEEKRNALFPYSPEHVVRRKDLVDLFDTTADLAGNDIDVARFIRDGTELDVQVFWRIVTGGAPTIDQKEPRREELCAVPFHKFRDFLKGKNAFRWDPLDGEWKKAVADAVFPGQVFLVPSDQGGYDPNTGWDAKSLIAVEELPPPSYPIPLEQFDGDPWSEFQWQWQSIAEHTNEVVAEVEKIVNALPLDDTWRSALRLAARWHDCGKAHEVFQDAIRDGAERPESWCGRRDIAKAPRSAWGRGYSRPHFRHEMASVLAMIQARLPDLAVYLAAAHHGKVRLSIRALPNELHPKDPRQRFARGVWDGDTLPKIELGGNVWSPEVALNLEVMELGQSGEQASWSDRMLRLRDDPALGVFRLVLLETVLRAADMRASAAHDRRDGVRAHA